MNDSNQNQRAFLSSNRRHILMISNHGIHQWDVLPGLPDTGGQNVFVNQFTAALVEEGFKVTIVNRGGYPHPITGEMRRGKRYRGTYQRILYLDDGLATFIRKEEMAARMPALVTALQEALAADKNPVDFMISHYWDGAALGAQYNQQQPHPIPHVWVPHSLGTVKKRNVDPASWAELHIDERIAREQRLLTQVDSVAATSSTIRQALRDDYKYAGPLTFLPPCVDTNRYYPREVPPADALWAFLCDRAGISSDAIRSRKIITEISRTDTTKRKDILIRAFAQVHQQMPDTLLVVAIDESKRNLAQDLHELIKTLNLERAVAPVGVIPQLLPRLYAASEVYCTPSVMEGFGMSAQEAAASGVPVVASHLVPFATEYLIGDSARKVPVAKSPHPLRQGDGALIVQADDVQGFAAACLRLLRDDTLRAAMGHNAYHITVPYFTWPARVQAFLDTLMEVPQ